MNKPKWTRDDFIAYYGGCYLKINGSIVQVLEGQRANLTNDTIHIQDAQGIISALEINTLNEWKHLTPPKLGWRNFNALGVPLHMSIDDDKVGFKKAYFPKAIKFQLPFLCSVYARRMLGKDYLTSIEHSFPKDQIFDPTFVPNFTAAVRSIEEGDCLGRALNHNLAVVRNSNSDYSVSLVMDHLVINNFDPVRIAWKNAPGSIEKNLMRGINPPYEII